MFFRSRKNKKQAQTQVAESALSISKDQVRNQMAKLSDVNLQLDQVVRENNKVSRAAVKRIKKLSYDQFDLGFSDTKTFY